MIAVLHSIYTKAFCKYKKLSYSLISSVNNFVIYDFILIIEKDDFILTFSCLLALIRETSVMSDLEEFIKYK